MSPQLLSGGTRRRQRARWPYVALVVFTAVSVAAVLAFFPAGGGEHSRLRPIDAPAAPPPPDPVRRPPAPAYGRLPAPSGQHVRIRFAHAPKEGLLWDLRTGKVLWSRQPWLRVPIASLTKMMTALVVVEHSHPGEKVLITKEAVHFTGSGIGLLPKGKKVPLEALLYGLLLPSGNDAAIALAQHVAGSRPRFIAAMNAEAKRLDLRCTHFTSVSGLGDRGNYSCARDLALLARADLAQPRIARVTRTPFAALNFPIKGHKLYLYNNNPLLRLRYPGTTGLKTGYTDAAGRCLVATARHGKRALGVVLLHASDPSVQAPRLLNAGFRRLRG